MKITIARQCGSGGHKVADILSEKLGMVDVLDSFTDLKCEAGIDCRNYGVMDGIPEAKRLWLQ